MDNNELQHHGILGMKWGVRRTPEQLGRGKGSSVKRKTSAKDRVKKAEETEPKKKSVTEMSDDELKAKISRLDLEKRYKDLSTSVNPPKSTRGKDFTLRVIEKIGENTLVNLGTQAANTLIGEGINKVFGVDSSDAAKRIVNPRKGQIDKK